MRQKLKAKEWDEFLAKGKRVRMLQPLWIGCVWAGGAHCPAADLQVLQQFEACLLEAAPTEDKPAPKASGREKRDQQSEWGLRDAVPGYSTQYPWAQLCRRDFPKQRRS